MLEVELKYRLTHGGALIAQLVELGATDEGTVHQIDQYFNHPQRNFAQTDEAVRVRETNGRGALTYKGPLVDQETKTRREIELDFQGADAGARMRELLVAVGFRPVHPVEKTRQIWRLTREGREIEIALDDVVGLGRFVELETSAEDHDLPAAREAIQSLATDLGLHEGERRGYLTLLLAQSPHEQGA